MKKIYFIFCLLSVSVLSHAQLQNLDFENWDEPVIEVGNRPTGWILTNGLFTTPGYSFLHPRQTDAQSNSYALMLSVHYYYTKDAAVQTAAIDYRVAHLKGYYKYENNTISGPNGETEDTAMVVVYLTKFNAMTLQSDTIGSGSIGLNQSDNYVPFDVNITYTTNDLPDSIHVLLDPSLVNRYEAYIYSHWPEPLASFFTVDNLSLEGEAVVSADKLSNENNMIIYPNPATDNLTISMKYRSNVSIHDITGALIESFNAKPTHQLDISNYAVGIYIIKSDEGMVRFTKY